MARGKRTTPPDDGKGRFLAILNAIPAWVSALVAAVGLVLVIVGYNATRTAPAPSVPGVTVTSVQCCSNGLEAAGEYRALRSGREVVVLMARPAGAASDQLYVHVQARLSRDRSDETAGLEDGRWSVSMPIAAGGKDWVIQPAILPGLPAGLDEGSLADLTRRGPASTLIRALGEAQTVSE